MTFQTIYELSEGWSVRTPLGPGTVLLITTPSYLSNPVVYVKLDTGELKLFDTNDIALYGSPTYGEQRIPEKAKEWMKKDS